ncbi:MAG: hypothetical protein KC609_06370, partial [Myxococcales bacterium]|nr:hypothetical protein [Myxococcales bacterium]
TDIGMADTLDVLSIDLVGDVDDDSLLAGDTQDLVESDSSTPPDGSDAAPDGVDSDEPFDPSVLLGVLGLPPSGSHVKLADLEVRNDRNLARLREVAFSAIPIAKEDDLRAIDKLVVVDDQGQRIQAQFQVLARWGRALGDPSDASTPIRWLQVSFTLQIGANQTRTFELRRYDDPVTTVDPLPLLVNATADAITIDTGAASFQLNRWNPALLESAELTLANGSKSMVYQHAPGAGPRLVLKDQTSLTTASAYDKDTVSDVSVDRDPSGKPDVTIVENGPIRVSILVRGHFTSSHPDAFAVCDESRFALPTHRFGFSAVLTFTRGQSGVALRYNLRNECGRTPFEYQTDDAITIGSASWTFSLVPGSETLLYSGISGDPVLLSSETDPRIVVEQQPGTDLSATWKRRARTLLNPGAQNESTLESGELLEKPLVGSERSGYLALLQMPWIRFREPQGLMAYSGRLTALFVSSTLHIGEAKAIWGEALLRFTLGNPIAELPTIRDRGQAQLERGLLVRLPLEQFNRTKVYPSLGRTNVSNSLLRQSYLAALTAVHAKTVGYPVHPLPSEPGQWARAFTYGSQLWPDVQWNTWNAPTNSGPFDNDVAGNVGSPMESELLEFYRSGDPRWVWDIALPLARLMIFTAAYNVSQQETMFNGIVPASGGIGEGDWHRDADHWGWSRGQTWNGGLRDAYLLRPDPLFIDRFRTAGKSSSDFFPTFEGNRDWFQAVEFSDKFSNDESSALQIFMTIESLQNCAEFVPGDDSTFCLAELERLTSELVSDNLTTGLPCDGETKPPDDGSCNVAFFDILLSNAFVPLYRYATNFASDPAPWKAMLLKLGGYALSELVQKNGSALTLSSHWPYALTCTIASGLVTSCTANPSESYQFASPFFPNALSVLGALREWDPTLVECATLKSWFATSALYNSFSTEIGDKLGWDEGAAWAVRHVIFGVGALDECLAN